MKGAVELPLRIGVGIILLNEKNKIFVGKRIDNPNNFWQMPQGGVNENENIFQAAKRELQEETGIDDFRLIENFRHKITYNVHRNNKIIPKEVIFFLAESSTKSVQLSSEHQNHIWLNFDLAHDRLTYTNAKELLVKAKSFLEK